PPLLNSVDLFVMPSHAELQSIATLEAMASGLPILAANARALPELVKADVNGWLFTAGDIANAADILALSLAHRRRWPTMGTASRQIAKSHAHEKSVAQYVHWYQQAAYGYRTNLATEELAMAH
ncbi:MAG: glycosyltransferase, partial [Caldilineaceae bacterium]|nr:glycosyltransferase [Caldilineaceae bacterium]